MFQGESTYLDGPWDPFFGPKVLQDLDVAPPYQWRYVDEKFGGAQGDEETLPGFFNGGISVMPHRNRPQNLPKALKILLKNFGLYLVN